MIPDCNTYLLYIWRIHQKKKKDKKKDKKVRPGKTTCKIVISHVNLLVAG